MKLICIFLYTLVLISCASHTGIVSIGKDTYMIAKQQATGFPGLGNMKAEIITEGNSYCQGQSKEFQIVSTNETKPPYILGNYPRSEITFMCISSVDPALQRPILQESPSTIIEIRKR